MKPGTLWPYVIAGALGIHVVASLVVVFVATSDPSYAVEEDYYQKAMAWNDKRAQDRINDTLGWDLEFEIEQPGAPGNEPVLEAWVYDVEGAPVTGATVSVAAFHNNRSGDIIKIQLTAAGDGAYRTPVPMDRNGRWELRFSVDRGSDHFTHTEIRHLFVEGSWR